MSARWERPSRSRRHHLRVDGVTRRDGAAPLMAGEVQRLRYDVQYSGDEDSEPICAVHIVWPVDRLTVRVSFDTAALPVSARRVDGLPPDAASYPGVPLRVDASGYVEACWERPAISRLHGIAWEWLPPAS